MTERAPIPNDIREAASRWFAARELDELDTSGEAAFRAWLDADPLHREAYGRAEAVWAAMDEPLASSAAPLPPVIAPEPIRQSRVPQSWLSARVACRLAIRGGLAAGIALVLVFGADLPMRLRADAITAVGEQRSIRLADGSTALLDTDSAIAIDARDAREITLLRGDAAFTVAKGKRPFVVRSNEGNVTALGTRFLVRRDGESTSATVTEHRVRVEQNGVARVVGEGWQVRYGVAGVSRPERVPVETVDAWTRGRLRVVNRPLGEVVAELSRYHSGYIGLSGKGLAELSVSGVFDLHDPVAAIGVIEQTLKLESVRLTDRIIILHRA